MIRNAVALSAALAAVCIQASVLGEVPLPEHPRPDFERADWVNLNGRWDFGFASNRLDRAISVPFGWGSPLSGVADEGDVAWYRRTVEIPEAWAGRRVFVVIGASDYDTDVWIDDVHLGKHWGGYLPFEFELTPFARAGARHVLTVRVDDRYEPWRLDGKQGYGNVRGIWQTVYLEARPADYLEAVRFAPDLAAERTRVELELGAPASKDIPVTVTFAPETGIPPVRGTVPSGEATLSLDVAMRGARRWTLEDPFLHEVVVRCGEDAVKSYFGYRSISVVRVPSLDAPYVALNGKPVYLRMPLDQSYTHEGYYTFPDDDYARREIAVLRELGLNATRIHIKAEVPRKLYWADRLGVLVMADVPCPPGGDLPDASRGQGVTPGGMQEVERCFKGMLGRDFNHPSIFSWVLFNEMWGLRSRVPLNKPWNVEYLPQTQRQVARFWRMAKAADPTRLIDDNSCAPHNEKGHTRTDLHSWHGYYVGRQWDGVVADEVAKTYPGSGWRYVDGCSYRGGEPNINAECGNVWGIRGGAGDSDWSWDYHLMMNAFRRHLKCAGWCYTELHDVPGEWNGYVRYDRTMKEPGLGDLCPDMSLRDLHADAYLLPGRELGRAFAEGERCRMPVALSLTTDALCGRQVRLSCELRWFDACGRLRVRRVPTGAGGRDLSFVAPAWTNASVAEIDLALPKGPAAGTAAFRLNDGDRVVARNFACFAVTNGALSAARVTVAPDDFTSSRWSEPVKGRPAAVEKTSGGGTGYFEYAFDVGSLPGDRPLVFRAECSTKRVYARDRGNVRGVNEAVAFGLDFGAGDPGGNLSTCAMTGAHPHAGAVRVSANGVFLKRIELPDEPADHRGILSWMAQAQPEKGQAQPLRDAGSYGYLVEVEVPAAVRRPGEPLRIRLDAEGTGLAVYGGRFGRYPFGPHVEAMR